MANLDLADLFLRGVASYGPLVLGLALFLGPAGLPIPTGLLVLAAGAWARQGDLSWSVALVIGLAATLLGDATSYGLGRFAGGWAQRCPGGSRAAAWARAQRWFKERGGLALYATRVVLTSLDVPTNLIAGGSRYAFRRFLAWDVLGRITWIVLYGGLGYLLGSRWEAASQVLESYGGWLGITAAVGAGAWYVLRRVRQSQTAAGQTTIRA